MLRKIEEGLRTPTNEQRLGIQGARSRRRRVHQGRRREAEGDEDELMRLFASPRSEPQTHRYDEETGAKRPRTTRTGRRPGYLRHNARLSMAFSDGHTPSLRLSRAICCARSTALSMLAACGLVWLRSTVRRAGLGRPQARRKEKHGWFFSAVKVMAKFNHVNFTIIRACY